MENILNKFENTEGKTVKHIFFTLHISVFFYLKVHNQIFLVTLH